MRPIPSEYCLLHQDDSWIPHQIDHVISRKHGSESSAENLAYCCLRCNLSKGTEGEVTARLLRLNLDKRVAERRMLIAAGRYAPTECRGC